MKNHTKIFWFMAFHIKNWLVLDGFIKVYHGARYLVLFGPENYDAIYNRVRYLINIL